MLRRKVGSSLDVMKACIRVSKGMDGRRPAFFFFFQAEKGQLWQPDLCGVRMRRHSKVTVSRDCECNVITTRNDG